MWRLWDFAQPSPKRDIYGRPDADLGGDRTVRSGRQVANGPQKRHLRVGVDRVLDAIDLDLWHGILCCAAIEFGSFIQGIEIRDDVLSIGFFGDEDDDVV